jgi:hypothetical protein
MALSNIFTEPRREITETAVGLSLIGVVLGGYIYGAYAMASMAKSEFRSFESDMFSAFFVEFFATLLLVGFVAVAHALGEFVCGALDKRGI